MDSDDWEDQGGFCATVPTSLVTALSGAITAAFDEWMDEQGLDEMDSQVGTAACLVAIQNALSFMDGQRSFDGNTIN